MNPFCTLLFSDPSLTTLPFWSGDKFKMKSVISFLAAVLLCIASPVLSRPSYGISQRQETDRLVFCHFMVRLLNSDPSVVPTI